ncbi:MAG: lactoylglutathione lyase [Candidimonas sp.]|nr:MAG: lactoylglutathione lyase [Candidimonas sp.]TAM22556.1 MAG: lactoylglutathione lyase [Candidimonas sp.]TAM75958.1 MAG: lactoylglutathione lyase [Candidimonas sp.]
MAKLIHTMVRVGDLPRSVNFYSDAFGLNETHRLDFPTFTLVYLGNEASQAELELTFNKNQEAPYVHGTAYGHVAFAQADLDRSHARMVAAGYAPTPIKQLEQDGVVLARFFFMSDPDGYKIEVLQEAGHYR